MIIFTVPKSFKGEFNIIQRNAINSWLSIKPKPTILLLGNEDEMEKIAKEYNLIHIKNLKKNKYGTPLLDDIFLKAQKNHKNEIFAYINTDIVLVNSPIPSLRLLAKRFSSFLAIGRRFEMKIEKLINNEEIAREVLLLDLKQKSNSWMDYFIFTQGVFDKIPPFALGRTFWDKWLVWSVQQKGIPTIDMTDGLFAIHQSHSYLMNNKTNMKKVWAGKEALENLKLAGGWSHTMNIGNAQFKLSKGIIHTQKLKMETKRHILDLFPSLWPLFLKMRLLRESYYLIMNQK